jgi:glycosyltransferase involved in cell wall biosynthesis
MDWLAPCVAVIPCHNEEATIAGLVREVQVYLSTVIVVDDGSTDATAKRAAAADAMVVRRKGHFGKGAALRAGLQTAALGGQTWALTLDGDGQHRPSDIPLFLDCVKATAADLVVGNRMHNAAAIPWARRRVNQWMSRRLSERAGQFLPDSQCGFRMINLTAWATMRLETDHFEVESEMLLAFVRARYRVEFVPIQVVGRGAHSHIRFVRDARRWLAWWRAARQD